MNILKLFVFLFSFSLFFACKKDDSFTYNEVSKTVSITGMDTLVFYLGSFGDEEGASIHMQAEYFQLSEVERDMSNFSDIYYYYKAEESFTGTDYVELKSMRGSDGASENTDITITKLTIEVE